MANRAELIFVQKSMKINRQRKLQDDHEKVVKRLQSDNENECKPHRKQGCNIIMSRRAVAAAGQSMSTPSAEATAYEGRKA
jgi:hypothetical protein